MAEYRQNTGYDKLIASSGEWDESKHPRDDDGKFTSGGGYDAEVYYQMD